MSFRRIDEGVALGIDCGVQVAWISEVDRNKEEKVTQPPDAGIGASRPATLPQRWKIKYCSDVSQLVASINVEFQEIKTLEIKNIIQFHTN